MLQSGFGAIGTENSLFLLLGFIGLVKEADVARCMARKEPLNVSHQGENGFAIEYFLNEHAHVSRSGLE